MAILSVIIPTLDRPETVSRLLESLQKQSVHPQEIIIVDAGRGKIPDYEKAFPGLNIILKHTSPPGLTRQRNIGLGMLSERTDLVCFLDDDIVFPES